MNKINIHILIDINILPLFSDELLLFNLLVCHLHNSIRLMMIFHRRICFQLFAPIDISIDRLHQHCHCHNSYDILEWCQAFVVGRHHSRTETFDVCLRLKSNRFKYHKENVRTVLTYNFSFLIKTSWILYFSVLIYARTLKSYQLSHNQK